MASILIKIKEYIKNKTFNIVKEINSNSGFSYSKFSGVPTILPAECFNPESTEYLAFFNNYQNNTSAVATDTAILTGANVLEKYQTKKARVITSTPEQYGAVCDIGFDGELQSDRCSLSNKSIRPAIVFSSLSDIPPTAYKDYHEIVRFTCGEYPQTAVSQKLQRELDYILSSDYEIKKSGIFKTGKTFSFFEKQENDESARLIQLEEYCYNGEKFVRIPSAIFNYYLTLSNDQIITAQKSEEVWVKVEPVTFILNPVQNKNGEYVAISENALVSGVPFDTFSTNYETSNLKLFLELRMMPEIVGDAVTTKNYVVPEGYVALGNNVFSGINGLEHVVLPHTLSYINYSAFSNSNLSRISYKTKDGKLLTTIIPEAQKLDSVSTYQNGIIVYSKGELPTETTLSYLLKDGSYAVLNNVNSQKIAQLAVDGKLDLVFDWEQSKQQLSKGMQKRSIPHGFVLEALGTDKEIIKKYYETVSTGLGKLEDQPWFKNCSHADQVQLVRLYATMGGLETDVTHQANITNIICDMKKFYGEDFSKVLKKLNLPAGLEHTTQTVLEYQHDKDNKIILVDGAAQIKGEKQLFFYKQIYNFIAEYYADPNFVDVVGTLTTKYYDVLNFYKQKLEKNNPDRHSGINPNNYERIKADGINPGLVQEYMFNCRYHTENVELQQVLTQLKSQYNLNPAVVSRFDKLITEAKILEARADALNKVSAEPVRLKYFMPDVEDDKEDGEFRFVWPPLSSATAITIGQRLGTCFRPNGKNEAGLINYITDKRDNLMILFDSNNQPCGYCRVNYDVNNKGILIDTIDLSDELALNKDKHKVIWETFERGVFKMAEAMNADGKYPVVRISCKPDPYNKVLHIVQKQYLPASKLKAKLLAERFYSTKQDIPHQKYYSQYLPTEEQLILKSPELTAYTEKQKTPNPMEIV